MNQIKKFQEGFVFCTATILFSFGVMVLWTAHQSDRVLYGADPILPLPSSYVFYIVGALGLAASAYLLVVNSRHATTKLLLITWLAVNYLAYAIGLRVTNGANLFSCLGNVNNEMPIPPKILDLMLFIYFGGLLLGALMLLIFGWFAQSKQVSAEPIAVSILQSR